MLKCENVFLYPIEHHWIHKKKVEVASHHPDAFYKKVVPQTKHPRKILTGVGGHHSPATPLKNLLIYLQCK